MNATLSANYKAYIQRVYRLNFQCTPTTVHYSVYNSLQRSTSVGLWAHRRILCRKRRSAKKRPLSYTCQQTFKNETQVCYWDQFRKASNKYTGTKFIKALIILFWAKHKRLLRRDSTQRGSIRFVIPFGQKHTFVETIAHKWQYKKNGPAINAPYHFTFEPTFIICWSPKKCRMYNTLQREGFWLKMSTILDNTVRDCKDCFGTETDFKHKRLPELFPPNDSPHLLQLILLAHYSERRWTANIMLLLLSSTRI